MQSHCSGFLVSHGQHMLKELCRSCATCKALQAHDLCVLQYGLCQDLDKLGEYNIVLKDVDHAGR